MTDEISREELLPRALDHLRSAIQLLDLADAPGEIAAHVDLGACYLAELIEGQRMVPLPQSTVAESCERL